MLLGIVVKWTQRYKGNKNEDDVESQSGAGGGEEDTDWADGDDDGADDDGYEQLDGDYGVHFSDERPPQFRALEHHRIQRPRTAFQIGFSEWLVPHLAAAMVMTEKLRN